LGISHPFPAQAIARARIDRGRTSHISVASTSMRLMVGRLDGSQRKGSASNRSRVEVGLKIFHAGDGDSYGAHYAYNIAAEADVRGALGAAYDDETRPAIAACVAAVHARAGRGLPAGALVFVGFDFIVDDGGAPWLLEANVKPAARYADVDAQFQSPVARRRAGNDTRRGPARRSFEPRSKSFRLIFGRIDVARRVRERKGWAGPVRGRSTSWRLCCVSRCGDSRRPRWRISRASSTAAPRPGRGRPGSRCRAAAARGPRGKVWVVAGSRGARRQRAPSLSRCLPQQTKVPIDATRSSV